MLTYRSVSGADFSYGKQPEPMQAKDFCLKRCCLTCAKIQRILEYRDVILKNIPKIS